MCVTVTRHFFEMNDLPSDLNSMLLHWALDHSAHTLSLVNKDMRQCIFAYIQMLPADASCGLLVKICGLQRYRAPWRMWSSDVFIVSPFDLLFYHHMPHIPWWGGVFKVTPALHAMIMGDMTDDSGREDHRFCHAFRRVIRLHVYIVCVQRKTLQPLFAHSLDEADLSSSVVSDVAFLQCVLVQVSVDPCLWFTKLRSQNIGCAGHAMDLAVLMVHREVSVETVYRQYARDVQNIKLDSQSIQHSFRSTNSVNNTRYKFCTHMHSVIANHSVEGTGTPFLRRYITLNGKGAGCIIRVDVPFYASLSYHVQSSHLQEFLPDDVVVDNMPLVDFWKHILHNWPMFMADYQLWKNTQHYFRF